MRSSNSGIDHRRATLMGVSLPSRHGALPQAPCMRKPWRVALDCPRAYEGRRRARSDMRRCFALISLLAALSSFPLLADDPLPPQHTFGPDTTRTGLFTGTGTALGLTCNASAAPMECSGFLASDVDGTALDVTLKIPGGTAPFPLVVNLHGYGGSKQSDSSWDDKLLLRGYAVLRYSARGFGKSWGQVNLADLNVELRDLRSMIAQAIEDPQMGPRLNPDAVAVLGASYGGGQSWLAALQPQFATPAGKTVRVRTIVPIVPWTDLVGALRPNGDLADSIDPPGSYK